MLSEWQKRIVAKYGGFKIVYCAAKGTHLQNVNVQLSIIMKEVFEGSDVIDIHEQCGIVSHSVFVDVVLILKYLNFINDRLDLLITIVIDNSTPYERGTKCRRDNTLSATPSGSAYIQNMYEC